MRKNQKYRQEDMYAAIRRCEIEGITYAHYCKTAGIHYATFKHWIEKYNKENICEAPAKSFYPVQVSSPAEISDHITITTTNGTRIECPLEISEAQLSVMLKILS